MPDHPPPVTEPTAEDLAHRIKTMMDWLAVAPALRKEVEAALSRLAQVERERDASDTALAYYVFKHMPWQDVFAEYARAAIERHKRSRQQRGT